MMMVATWQKPCIFLLTLPGEALLGIKKDFYAHAVQGFHVEEQARKVEEWLFNIY